MTALDVATKQETAEDILASIDFKNSPDIREEISNYVIMGKYSRHRDDLGRRETWGEAVDRVESMHLRRFMHLDKEYLDEIKSAFDMVREKKVGPSMRSMQFGGKAVEAANPRTYNCAVRHVDSIRAFSEIFYLLLCGVGVGIGLKYKFLNRMPNLVSADDKTGIVMTYVVEDTIEGWADSVEALLMCYFVNTAFSGRKIVFDYSRIRPAGSPLKTSGGKAPGHEGLKAAHAKIKKLLDAIIEVKGQGKLKTIDAYDILMHVADAVLSGGIRRSATSVIFDKDDKDMINAKTGNWFETNPQRARSNNSVLLLRDSTTQEEFDVIFQRTKEWGEPGFVWADHEDSLMNPCQPSWAPIVTKSGIKKMEDVLIGDEIWSESGWTKVVNKWSTGVKDVFEYRTTSGIFYGTENHRVVSGGHKIEAKDAESIDILVGPEITEVKHDPAVVMDGLVLGDGTVHKASNNLVLLVVGDGDGDYFYSEISGLIGPHRPGVDERVWEVQTNISSDELPKTYNRSIPDRYIYAEPSVVASFLRGLYSANGSVVSDRVTLKTSSQDIRDSVQVMLSSLGIASYFTTNKEHDVEFSNGTYTSKESYDVNITRGRDRFSELIGFIEDYKNNKLAEHLGKSRGNGGKTEYDIISKRYVSTEEVFDITVDNSEHTYWTGGVNVSNCFEINFIPITDDGVCAVQFCNLSTINASKIESKEDFLKACWAASLIGTLQASYTDFPYLSHQSEELTREEALLGVSMTGMFDNPSISFDPDLQEKGAEVVKNVNERWAKTIGINPAARTTCLKPEGSSSLAFGTMASGIHASHARYMFRRIQSNKLDNVYRHFKMHNNHSTEESVWSANKTDDVVAFPIRVPDDAILKPDLDAITHLEYVRLTQKHWVIPGTSIHNKKPLTHNVSCTIVVKDQEWDDVASYMFNNRNHFSAVSFLSDAGDKAYAQAPNEAVKTVEDARKFKELAENWIKVDYSTMTEDEDNTSLSHELACAGAEGCEITSL